MSDIYREQHPLLNEDPSDEEQKPVDRVHRSSPILFRGYARNSAKGAAAIIRTWPDSITSLLPYLWTMLAVTGIITFVFYNTITVALLPAYAKALHQLEYSEDQTGNGVYMHIIVQNKEETQRNEYYPLIQQLANQYKDYRFYLIYLFNDTTQSKEGFLDEREQFDPFAKKVRFLNRVVIKILNLSNYLDASPLAKVWRRVPATHLEFLVRAVSIWQKGGLAFNPVILTPKWPNLNYTKKLHEYLGKNNRTTTPKRSKFHMRKQKFKQKRVNNIQDIINNVEDNNLLEDNMIGEESILIPNVAKTVLTNLTDLGSHNITLESEKPRNKSQIKWEKQLNYDFIGRSIENSIVNHSSLFPMFLDFIFHSNKPDIKLLDTNLIENTDPVESDKVVEYLYTGSNERETNIDRKLSHVPKENLTTQVPKSSEYNNDLNATDVFTIMIDLKGYFIATRTHCHSFLGTMFSNARYLEESRTVRDLIVGELTMYCEGVLSLCDVIDVIW